MLERVWRKGNPLTLLVGMQTSTATKETNSVTGLLKFQPYAECAFTVKGWESIPGKY